ncbi:hypothetical protein GCM10007415_23200 [Parapedobacter pyrenivorans]|uniref:DUF1680 family protein n=2 Tax=Parapedobacter pyrenivorans TaxID=1305674 RepID=A0A917MAY1_9SPHI|nr:hypothetical protein GCM10007415_23200 [Parapedobacter pyrenivorans]
MFRMIGLAVCGGVFCVSLHGQELNPVPYGQLRVSGELETRSLRNFDRLESDIYTPDNVFPVAHEGVSAGWPGDYEGRIILGLTLQAQATHREPKYLAELIDRIDTRVNAKGYLGPIMQDSILEQQLSGHGWLLRGLCEYYAWKQDDRVKQHIKNIITNLALPTKGYHAKYPIDPDERLHDVGEASGTTQNAIGNWLLSSDIGCDFIFMDGVIHAYTLFPDPELKGLIDEMVARFLQMDLVRIKAQTHATLTAIRGLLRYYEVTKDDKLLKAAANRYALYRDEAMTETYANFNWFGRPEWTEPCAIVDAFMVATQLWQDSGDPHYLQDAHLIYYNAMTHAQRANGGFGLDNCPGPEDDVLSVHTDEAYWCCTMRGGEGLAAAIQYTYFTGGKNRVYLPFFNTSEVSVPRSGGETTLLQRSQYPYKGHIELEVLATQGNNNATRLHLFAPEWAEDPAITVNGSPVSYGKKAGFLVVRSKLKQGDKIQYTFSMQPRLQPLSNTTIDRPGDRKISYGPLVLGHPGSEKRVLSEATPINRLGKDKWQVGESDPYSLTPIFHTLDPAVREGATYHKQVIFEVKDH